jgi:type IV fimbrial biogenesis protein FimT
MKTSRHSKGLTLVELMTVLAILALSLLLVAPSISGYLEDRKIRNAAESLFYGMQKARLHAVQTNIQTQFQWVGQGWTISQLNMATDPPTLVSPSLESFNWNGVDAKWTSVVVNATPATGTIVTFDGLGWVLQTNLTANSGAPPDQFDVSSSLTGSRALRIIVNRGSGLRVCDPQLLSSDPKGCPD